MTGLLWLALFLPASAGAEQQPSAERGAYLSKAGGCLGCHTEAREDAPPYAGGRAIATRFGTFFGPNITPHPRAGIGAWSEEEFVAAMREGRRPDGAHYYPSFPYSSFTKIVDQDLRDLWAYLRNLPPSERANRPHELRFPFGWRSLNWGWKLLFFSPGAFVPDPARDVMVNRGAYLTNALGHCGECHTPRNFLGGPRGTRHLAGGTLDEGADAPNLTPTRLEHVSDAELKDFLVTAMTPDGDVAAESMAEVVRNTTSQLTPTDLEAMVVYLRSLPPLPDEPK